MNKYTPDTFKRQYPRGIVIDLREWDDNESIFLSSKKVVFFMYASHPIAIIDFSERKSGRSFFPGYFCLWLYNGQQKTKSLTPMLVLAQLYKPIKTLRKLAYKMRDAIAKVYPQKAIIYKFDPPITQCDYDILADILPQYVWRAKMLKAEYSPSGKIVSTGIAINLAPKPEEIANFIQQDIKSGTLFKDDSCEKNPEFCDLILKDFPEKAKVFRLIPRKILADRFPDDIRLLSTLGFKIKSIHWLYKLSESTLGLPSDSKVNEIHVILVDFKQLITIDHNRYINNTVFSHVYEYGFSFYNEEKFLSYMDMLIPYQTVYILKISGYKGVEFYQIWSGLKSTTLKGTKVKQYNHSKWMELHYNGETATKENRSFTNKFSLALIGNDLRSIMANFIAQLDDTKKDK